MAKPERTLTYFTQVDNTSGVIYTCPSNCKAIVVSMGVDKVSGAGTTGGFSVTQGGSTYQVSESATVPYATTEIIVILEAGDTISLTADTNVLDGFVTVKETFIPVG